MANPFSVDVPNVNNALQQLMQGYQFTSGIGQQQQQKAARQTAMQALMNGGDTRNALAALIGAGDIQGANALSNFGNQDFERFYKTQMLDLQRKQLDKKEVPSGFRQSANGGLAPIPGGPADPAYKRTVTDKQNAPAGYKWNDPNNPDAGLIPIPGGPGEKVDAEVAARIGLGRSFLGQLPDSTNEKGEVVPGILSSVKAGEATGLIDWTAGMLGQGRAGEVHRRIASGAEALLRNLTGAGMNKDEAAEYVNRYRPSWRDDAKSLADKIVQLERELKSVMETVGRGRGGTLQPIPAGGPVAPPPRQAPTAPQAAPQAAADPLARAREAIQRGAPRDAVMKRLQEAGIDPSGL